MHRPERTARLISRSRFGRRNFAGRGGRVANAAARFAACIRRCVSAACELAARQPRLQPGHHVCHVRTRCRCASVRILPRLATCCCLSSCSGSSAFSGLDAASAAPRAEGRSVHAQHPMAAHASEHAPREAFCRLARHGPPRSILQALAGFGCDGRVRPLRLPAGASRSRLALTVPRRIAWQSRGMGLQRSTVRAAARPVQRLLRGIAMPARTPRRATHAGEGRRRVLS